MANDIEIEVAAKFNKDQTKLELSKLDRKLNLITNLKFDRKQIQEELTKSSTKLNLDVNFNTKNIQSKIKELSDQISKSENQIKLPDIESKVIENISNTNKKNNKQEQDKIAIIQKQIEYQQKLYALKLKDLNLKPKNIISNNNVQSELQKFQSTLNNLTPQNFNAKNLELQFKGINSVIKQTTASLNEGEKSSKGFINTLVHNASKFAEWLGIGAVVVGTIREFQNAVKYIIDMDTELTNLNKVVDLTVKQLESMKTTAISMGKELGRSSIEIMKSMAEFGRVTKNIDEINSLTRTAVMSANVTSMTADEAAKSLNSAMISFKINAKDSMGILDSWNELQNSYRVNAEDLSGSIGKVGAAAKQAGVSIQQLEGVTTGIVSASGISGDEAGTAIKGILSRVYRLGDSEDDGGAAEKLLASLGVAVRKNETEFRSFSDILTDLNSKWGTYSNITKTNIAQTLAGTYHYSKFINIMENYGMITEATNKAINSQGSAIRENEKYLNSSAAKLEQNKVALEELYTTFMSNSAIKLFATTMTGLINSISGIGKTFGSLSTIIFTASTAFFMFSKTIKSITWDNLASSVNNFKAKLSQATLENMKYNSSGAATNKLGATMAGMFTVLTGKTIAQTVATVGARIATMALQTTMSLGLSLVITGLISGISKLISRNKDLTQSMIDTSSKVKEVFSEIDELNSLVKEKEKLEKNTHQTTEQKQQLLEVEKQLANKVPDLTTAYGEQGEKLAQNTQIIKDYIEQKKKQAIADAQVAIGSAPKDIEKQQTHYRELLSMINSYKDLLATTQSISAGTNGKDDFEVNNIKYSREELSKWVKQWESGNFALSTGEKNLKDVEDEVKSFNNSQRLTYQYLLENNSGFSEFNTEIEKNKSFLFDLAGQYNLSAKETKAFLDKTNSLSIAMKSLSKDKDNAKLKINVDSAKKDIQDFFQYSIGVTKTGAENIGSSISDTIGIGFDIVSDKSGVFIEKLEKISDVLDSDTTKSLKEVNQLIYDMGKGNKLTAEETADLIAKNPQLANSIKKVGDGYVVEKGALDNVRKGLLDQESTALITQSNITKVTLTEIGKRLTAYSSEYEALSGIISNINIENQDSITKAQSELDKQMGVGIQPSKTGSILSWGKQEDQKKALSDTKDNLVKLKTLGEGIKANKETLAKLNDPHYGVKTDSSSKSKSSPADKETSKIDFKIDRYMELNSVIDDYDNKLAEIKAKEDSLNGKDKLDYIRQENELIKGKSTAIQNVIDKQQEESNTLKNKLSKNGFTFGNDGSLVGNQDRLNSLYNDVNHTKAGKERDAKESKAKELEEDVKRYFELLHKEIPKEKQEISSLTSEIAKNFGEISKSNIDTFSQISEGKINKLADSMTELNEAENLLSDNDYIGKADVLNKKLEVQQQITKKYNDDLWSFKHTLKDVDKTSKDYLETEIKLTKAKRDSQVETSKYIKAQQELIRENIKLAIEKEKELDELPINKTENNLSLEDRQKTLDFTKKELDIKNQLAVLDKAIFFVSEQQFKAFQQKKIDKIKEELKLNQDNLGLQKELEAEQNLSYNQITDFQSLYETINKSETDSIQNKIDLITKSEDYLSIEERDKIIQALKSDLIANNITSFDTQIEQMSTMADIKEKEVDLLKKQIDLEKQRIATANASKEKNVQIYQEGKGWVWSADPKKVQEEQDKLSDMEIDYAKYIKDEKNAQLKEDLQNQLDAKNDELRLKKDSYDRQNTLLTDALNKEKDAWKLQKDAVLATLEEQKIAIDTKFKDMDGKVSAGMSTVNTTFKGKLDEAVSYTADMASKALANLNSVYGYSMGTSISNSSGNSASASSNNQVVNVNPDGKAPSGLSVGTTVKTAGGNYQITGVKSDGSYTSVKKYKTGGLNTETGMHWLDGTPSEPEIILNATDTQNMLKMVDMTRSMIGNINLPNFNSTMKSNSNLFNSSKQGDTIINVGEVKTNDARGFVSNLKRQAGAYNPNK